MEVVITRSYEQMSKAAAQLVVDVLNTKPNAVLGMATGSTPLGLYQELVRLHQAGEVDFSRVTTFNLDEYVGLPANHPQSYHYFMDEHFFRHVNIPRHNINIPSGTTSNYPGHRLGRPHRVQRAGELAELADPAQDAVQADHRRQRPVLRRPRGRAGLCDHDGRRDHSRCATAGPGGEREE